MSLLSRIKKKDVLQAFGTLLKTAFVWCRMLTPGCPRSGVVLAQRPPPFRGMDTLVPLHWCCCLSAVLVHLVWRSFTEGGSNVLCSPLRR